MKSQSNSQSEADVILNRMGVKFQDLHFKSTEPHQTEYRNEAKTALLNLALSCLPEKKNPTPELRQAEGEKAQDYVRSLDYWDAAIDTIEQQIKERFP